MEKKKKKVRQLGLHPFPSVGSSYFILQFVFDFGNKIFLSLLKTNSPLLRINVFEAYQIWILGDPWINILCVIFSLTYLFLSNLPCAIGRSIGGLGTPDGF